MSSRKELVGALGALLRRIEYCDTIDAMRGGSVHDTAVRVYESALKGNVAPLPWTPLRRVPHGPPNEREIASIARTQNVDVAEVREQFARMLAEETLWVNEIYQVNMRDLGGGGRHLSIKRIDQQPIHDWRDMQRIKNELLGPECEMIELYPAEDRRVDTANSYHLWGSADPAFRFGFGFNERLVNHATGSHLQRDET